jgi:hypothetical protein
MEHRVMLRRIVPFSHGMFHKLLTHAAAENLGATVSDYPVEADSDHCIHSSLPVTTKNDYSPRAEVPRSVGTVSTQKRSIG